MVKLTNFPPPTEGIQHQQSDVSAYVEGKCLGKGVIYIADSRLSWFSDDGQGFSLEYPAVSLHAVSRDLGAFPQECLYLMIAGKISESENMEDGEDSTEEEEDDSFSEIRFVPGDKGTLDAMFNAMSHCQTLHPDEQDSGNNEEGPCFYEGEEDLEHLTEEGQQSLNHLESIFQVGASGDNPHNQQNGHRNPSDEESMEVGQFDDADG